MGWGDDSESWDEDPEGPSAEDLRRFSAETVRCSECGAEVHDESISCPICGRWMEAEGAEVRRRRTSVAVGVGLAVLLASGGVVWWLLRLLT